MPANFDDAITFNGVCTFTRVPSLPTGTVGSSQGNSSDPFDTTQVKHLHDVVYTQAHGSGVVAEQRIVRRCRDAEALVEAKAFLEVANDTGATITIDIQKASPGGSPATILTTPIVLDDGDAVYTAVTASLAAAAASLAAGDVVIVIVSVSGTVGEGLGVQLVFKGKGGGL